jgi:hypothetical protein
MLLLIGRLGKSARGLHQGAAKLNVHLSPLRACSNTGCWHAIIAIITTAVITITVNHPSRLTSTTFLMKVLDLDGNFGSALSNRAVCYLARNEVIQLSPTFAL